MQCMIVLWGCPLSLPVRVSRVRGGACIKMNTMTPDSSNPEDHTHKSNDSGALGLMSQGSRYRVEPSRVVDQDDEGERERVTEVCYIDRDAQGSPKWQPKGKGTDRPNTTKASHHGGRASDRRCFLDNTPLCRVSDPLLPLVTALLQCPCMHSSACQDPLFRFANRTASESLGPWLGEIALTCWGRHLENR